MSEPYAAVDLGKTLFQFDQRTGRYVEWYVADIIHTEDGAAAVLTHGDRRATHDLSELESAVVDRDNAAWVPALFDEHTEDGEPCWVPHPKHTEDGDVPTTDVSLRVGPASPSELSFERVSGRGSRTEVNTFLDGADDGLVAHELGGVASWKTAFVARYDGAIVSAIVLHYYNPAQNGDAICITRLANHPSAPKNTSTWMIARARRWAERTGHERIVAYAGVGGNEGTCYRAAGFEPEGDVERVTGKDWSGDQQVWERRKFVDDRLDPEVYADKSASWAVETVETSADTERGLPA